MPFRFHPLSFAVACALGGVLFTGGALAQTSDFQSATQLPERLDAQSRRDSPFFIKADKTTGQPDLTTVLEGNAELRRADTYIRADRVEYDMPTDMVNAQGKVRINRAGNIFEGPSLTLKVDAFEGALEDPVFSFLKNRSRGYAKRIVFDGPNRVITQDAVFSSCQNTNGLVWVPDWFLKANRIVLDEANDEGRIENGTIWFKNVPIFPVPSFGFPLTNKRRSGFLPPSLVVDNQSGVTVAAPYYWNIAPNRDVIITPEYASKRGSRVLLDARDLESVVRPTQGNAHLELMPTDQIRQRDRWAYSVNQVVTTPVLGNMTTLNLAANRVSDDNYWRDFTGAPGALSQRLLPTTASVSTGLPLALGTTSLSLRTFNWQVLQDMNETGGYITPPYDLLPQLTLGHQMLNVGGFDVQTQVQATKFQASRWYDCSQNTTNCQPNASRSLFKGQISRPWVKSFGYINPQVLLQARHYSFDRSGLGIPAGSSYSNLDSASVTVPSFVLDSGLYFDRQVRFGGQGLLQTLEPRLYYVNTPYRQQTQLPLYDTGLADFNFASVFASNVYSGEDRVADNRMVTMGVASRFIDPDSGAQLLKLAFAQRYRFANQRMTLLSTDTPTDERLSDMIVGASAALQQHIDLDAISQYSPKENRSLRSAIGLRYQPGWYKVINASYSQQRTTATPSELINGSWQWPVKTFAGNQDGASEGAWYSVGRMNYSSTDRRVVNALIGFEYDAGCWVGRVVLDRQQTALNQFNQRLMFELELSGFSRVGISPLGALKTQIPYYQPLRGGDPVPPSRFERYE